MNIWFTLKACAEAVVPGRSLVVYQQIPASSWKSITREILFPMHVKLQ
ncbi:hypothetical protein L1765_02435 [Microaerobacter geothermalis]|nr:hypothetical protein [Microaerobacter geothermalis]MCF6092854.1 hypothetical protein [Microaerobacter geothermalis]